MQSPTMTSMRNSYIIFVSAICLLVATGCSTASQIQRERTAQAHYKLGIAYLNNDELQQAFVEFQKALVSNSKYRDVHYALGHVYFQRGQWEEAKKELITTVKLDPDFAEAHNYLGKVYEKMGKWELAIEEYKKALKNLRYRTPHFAHYNLGLALMNTKDHEGALREFKEAIRIEPSFVIAYQAEGQAYSRLNRYGEAIEAFQQALEFNPSNPEVHFNLGVAYFKEDTRSKAKEAFEKVIELAPEGELSKNSKLYLDRLQ